MGAKERPTAMTTESGPGGHYVKHFHPMGERCSIRDEARAQVLDQLRAWLTMQNLEPHEWGTPIKAESVRDAVLMKIDRLIEERR